MLEIMKTEEFDQVYSLMENSFPSDEYRSYEEQKKLFEHPEYSIYVAHDLKNGAIEAFVAIWQFLDFVYIEHFAVHKTLRGQGIGSGILQEVIRMSEKQICLETELPETDIAKRRIAFYKRNGFFLNSYPYMQPPMSEGKQEVPLAVMTSKEHIAKDRFEKIRAVLYQKVYHQANAESRNFGREGAGWISEH